MFAPERTMGVSGGAAGRRPNSPSRAREHLPGLVIIGVVAGGLLAFFLGIYAVHHYVMPIGFDTPRYLFQTNLVAERGLAGIPHVLPPPVRTLASRAGFPVLTLSLSSLLASTTFQVGAVVPPLAAAAVALAAGAFASWTLRRPAWECAVVAVVVGTSAVVIRLLAPETYADNLIAGALFIAALVPIVAVMRDGRGFVAAALLLGVGGVAHLPFFGVILSVLALTLLAYGPGSWRAWSAGETPLLSTPSGRLGAVMAGAGAVVVAGVGGLLRTGPDPVKLTTGELREKLRADLPLYRLPLMVPLAAVGTTSIVLPSRRDPRRGDGPPASDAEPDRVTRSLVLVLLLAWVIVVAAGVLAFLVGVDSPAHRFLAFLLPLPIMVALGILAVARLGAAATRRRGSPTAARALGPAVAAVAVAGMVLLGARTFYDELPRERGVEWLSIDKVRDAATASAYLRAARVPVGAPVVFVVDDVGPKPEFLVPELMYMIRAVLPADRLEHAYVYVGDPERLVAGQPTTWTPGHASTPGGYEETSLRFWPAVQAILPLHPTALVLAGFDQAYFQEYARSHPDRVVGPGVALVLGSRPGVHVAAPTPPKGPNGILEGAWLGGGAMILVILAGMGWVLALFPFDLRPFEALALAPAVGLGSLLVGGILVDAAGGRLGGPGGIIAGVVAGGSGWWLAARARRHRRRAG